MAKIKKDNNVNFKDIKTEKDLENFLLKFKVRNSQNAKSSQKENFDLKQMFIDSMVAMKKQDLHDEKLNDAVTELFDDGGGFYKNFHVKNELIKIWKVLLNANYKDSLIDYFIYDLDYGTKYTEGCVTEKDGTSIDISTVGKLYNYLTKTKVK